jgi:hypothetical protein
MAFIDQVQDLTSLSVSDNDELSQFLKDGVIDVTNRWLLVRPQDIELFARESSEQTSNASLHLNGAKIISIIREDGTNNQWRNCRKISSALQYDVTDVDSLNYASKINPAYMVGNNGQISVFPAPGADPNAFKVYYVNNDPEDKGGTNLIHSHSDIGYFPDDKVYLVVIYAGMKLLQANMGATTITDLSVTAVPPDVPTISTISYTSATETDIGSVSDVTVTAITFPTADIPTYTKTSLQTARVSFDTFYEDTSSSNPFGTSSDPGSTVVTAVPPDVPTLGTGLPTYEVSTTSVGSGTIDAEIGQMLTYIETEEDVELANAKASEITLRLKRALEKFNADIAEYKTENEGELARYSTEINAYTADVNAQVQDYTQKLQRYSTELSNVFQAWQKTESDSLQEYQLNIQNELNEFNMENADFQLKFQEVVQEAKDANQVALQNMQKDLARAQADAQSDSARRLQDAIQSMQDDVANNASLIQKFQTEIQEYQAEVATQIQEYTQNLQADGIGYQWLQDQYAKLKAEYDTAFMIAAPKQQPQQGRV